MSAIKLVWDKADCSLRLGDVTLVAAPRTHPPFTCQAMVEEQDTYLLMAEQTTLKDPGKPAWYLANTLQQQEACQPGSVIIKSHAPIRLLAVVHNIDQEPTCHPAHISKAYQSLLQILQEKEISSVGLPLLGTVHGKLLITEAIALLADCVQAGLPESLQRIWLILPSGTGCECLAELKRIKGL